MVDFDTAAAAVQDPNADPVFLAKIAYENPEFGANVVANPRAYPGLKRWVAQFGDERARQQLVGVAGSAGRRYAEEYRNRSGTGTAIPNASAVSAAAAIVGSAVSDAIPVAGNRPIPA